MSLKEGNDTQKITPNLWFNGNAEEAVEFYTSVFQSGKTGQVVHYPLSAEEGLADFQQHMAGKVLTIDFTLADLDFTAINAGPEFRANPSISFMVNLDPARDVRARERLDELWAQLMDGGQELMPLQKYEFSDYCGWVQDRFGFSWQLILTDPLGEPRPIIMPVLMFGDQAQNRANEAINYYTSVFKNSHRGASYPYGTPTGPASAEALMFADFTLEDQWFVASDAGVDYGFNFNEAVSLAVACKDQAEIDYLWDRLSASPAHEQCGWCRDQFGVSWQIVPENIQELMSRPNAYRNMMSMKKLVIDEF